jgi:hypothetical protein
VIARIYVQGHLAAECDVGDPVVQPDGVRRAPAPNDTIDVVLHDEHPAPYARPLFARARAEELR